MRLPTCGGRTGAARRTEIPTDLFAFMSLPDESAIEWLPRQAGNATVIGESGVAGPAGPLLAVAQPEAQKSLRLDGGSRILLSGTEGVTDPAACNEIFGSGQS
jgi:diaminopropionate ammonia-lyase